jgi:hypothetical protein
MLKLDNNDPRAYIGIARSFRQLNKYSSSLYYYGEMKRKFPGNTDSDKGLLDLYKRLGYIYFVDNRPFTSYKFYKRAYQIDSSDNVTNKKLSGIKKELSLYVRTGISLYTDKFDNFSSSTLINSYTVSKRINNLTKLILAFQLSNRKFEWEGVNYEQLYDNTVLGVEFYIDRRNILSIVLGASYKDSTVTTYGVDWESNWILNPVTVSNSFIASYKYDKKYSQRYALDKMSADYKKFTVSASYKQGLVLKNYVYSLAEKTDNPFSNYNIGLSYKFLSTPSLRAGFSHSYTDYKYRSQLYNSPQNTSSNGLTLSLYHSLGPLNIYSYGYYGRTNYDFEFWTLYSSVNANVGNASFSLSFDNYNDVYYKSYDISGSISYDFNFMVMSLFLENFTDTYYKSKYINFSFSSRF